MNPSAETPIAPPIPTSNARPLKRRPGGTRLTKGAWKPTPYARAVGKWLRARRKQLGLTQRDAAQRGECSNAWICQLERASVDIWSTTVRSLGALCKAYSVEMDVLLRVLRVTKPES